MIITNAYILIKNKMIVIDIIGETAQQLSLYIECEMQLEMNFTYLNCNNSKTTKNINVNVSSPSLKIIQNIIDSFLRNKSCKSIRT